MKYRFSFYVLLLVSLLPLLVPGHLLTNDGPVHLYNARVLSDWLIDGKPEFYWRHYFLNDWNSPNWFSHIAMMGMLQVFSPLATEKIFFAVYILAFAFAFRGLVLAINPKAGWVALLGIPFIHYLIFWMGFYNFSFGIVFFFWFARHVILSEGRFNLRNGLVRFGMLGLLYFTHGLAFFFSGIFLGCYELVRLWSDRKGAWSEWIKTGLINLLIAAPWLFLLIQFQQRSYFTADHNSLTGLEIFLRFAHMKCMGVFTLLEEKAIVWFALVLGLALAGTVWKRFHKRQGVGADYLWPFLLFLLAFYFWAPGNLGSTLISHRLQIYPWMALLLCLAAVKRRRAPVLLIAVAWFFTCYLMWIKFPVIKENARAVNEYLEVLPEIEDGAILLPLSFEHNGPTLDGRGEINDRLWNHVHIGDYLGAYKPLIILDNFEAQTNWFGLRWKGGMSPYEFIGIDPGSIEGQPPVVDFNNPAEHKIDEELDYVILWGSAYADEAHPAVQSIRKQLKERFTLKYESTRLQLYAAN